MLKSKKEGPTTYSVVWRSLSGEGRGSVEIKAQVDLCAREHQINVKNGGQIVKEFAVEIGILESKLNCHGATDLVLKTDNKVNNHCLYIVR